MKTIRGIKIGGLQQKIFNLVLILILVLAGAYAASAIYQQKNMIGAVEEVNVRQQDSITAVSEETMQAVLEASMAKSTALQAYIADDLFSDVRTDVLTLQAFATELFANEDRFPAHPYAEPDAANDGRASFMMQHEEGVDPAGSEALGLAANMEEIMLAMFENSDKLSSCFVATPDGCILFADDRAGSYFSEDGQVYTFPVRERPWYQQAVEAGELIFTGVELDAFTDIPGLVCAAPVYRNGQLTAVVGADIFLDKVSDYVDNTAANGGFVCVISENGQVLFSPQEEGIFKAEHDAPDLRESENQQFAEFIRQALHEKTGLTRIEIDGKSYYMSGAPMPTLGWTVLSVVDEEITRQPTEAMLTQYDQIQQEAFSAFKQGAGRAAMWTLLLTLLIFLAALAGALVLSSRVVKPLEHMTRRINALSGSDQTFEMEKIYRTGDEIEILAESFENLSKRTRQYIKQITEITAEKERIGTELALATRIQADMLPNIYPAFPERPEFDVYATMTPAKEVGGDFYDFFLIDDTHLGLVMADVSGKGVPAALFMMVSKILVQNYAMTGRGPAEVLQAVNDQICANNREEMFVTVWLGILDTATGLIRAANAGHEYPVVKQPDGLFDLVKDKHGFIIGGMEGMRYKEYELQLAPGAKLFLYTDGVVEATNAEKELFGTQRMLEALNADPDAEPEAVLGNVHQAVNSFVKSADQFDDLTMLCLEYRGN